MYYIDLYGLVWVVGKWLFLCSGGWESSSFLVQKVRCFSSFNLMLMVWRIGREFQFLWKGWRMSFYVRGGGQYYDGDNVDVFISKV